MPVRRQDVRNVAIIAHVDHGKTSLVDCMLRQSGRYREAQLVGQQILDSNDLERERGITILAKNIAIPYQGVKINIIDTPGHADFGGEVERVLRMADGALVLVDAAEGPMPQTRFVLSKALECGLQPVIVINKIDRPDARPHEVIDEVFDLFMQLGAADALADFPYIFSSAKLGYATHDAAETSGTVAPLMDMILEQIPGPEIDPEAPLQMLVTTLDWSDYVGRIAVGRIYSGSVRPGQDVVLMQREGQVSPARIVSVHVFEDLGRIEVPVAEAGDIVALVGLEKIEIGDTISDPESPRALPRVVVDEPTLKMTFGVNTSPLAGQEGRFVTSRHLRERLDRELQTQRGPPRRAHRRHRTVLGGRPRHPPPLRAHRNHAPRRLRAFGGQTPSYPPPTRRRRRGALREPRRRGPRVEHRRRHGAGRAAPRPTGRDDLAQRVPLPAFLHPGAGIDRPADAAFERHPGHGGHPPSLRPLQAHGGRHSGRASGVLVSNAAGRGVAYGLDALQQRAEMHVGPGDVVYEGMIVGENSRTNDMTVNPTKEKKLSNMRAVGHDRNILLKPARRMSLEESLEFIADDELVEVTPSQIRLRKIILKEVDRRRADRALARQ